MNSDESLMCFSRLLHLRRTVVTLVSPPRSIDLLAGDWELSLPVMGTRICLLMRASPPSSMLSQHAVRLPLPGGATRPSSVARASRPRTRRLFARFSLSLTTQPSRESSTGSSGYARSVVPGLTAQRRLYGSRVVPFCLHRGDELRQYLLPLSLTRLKLFDAPEDLRLLTTDGGTVVASGLVIGLEAGRPFRIGYEVRCDGSWWAACPSLPGPGSRVPLPCPARADACSRGAGSVVVLQARPRLFERQLRVSTDVDRQVVLVGHAVAAPHRTGPFDAAEHALEAFPRNAH